MNDNDIIKSFWNDLFSRNKDVIAGYFSDNAEIKIHNLNKAMTAEEYINVRCRHKEKWNGEIVRLVSLNDLSVVVVKIKVPEKNLFYNIVGFMTFRDDKIVNNDEYWAENGQMSMWE